MIPKGPRVRPTQDQVRQALFNLLGGAVEGTRVLDLFAGSGALGLEAFSRGAAHVTFVDRSPFCIRAIRENLENLTPVPGTDTPFGTRYRVCRVIRADALAAIPKLAARGEIFGLVLLDPPYGGDLARKTLIALSGCAIVSDAGWVVAECDKRDPLPPSFEGAQARMKLQRLETYGDTALAFYQRQ